MKPITRFLKKVNITDTCWLWTASTQGNGYGQFSFEGRPVRAHRWAYQHFVGPIPDGMQLDHLCRNRKCVNPDHLEPVTGKENLRRSPLVGANQASLGNLQAWNEKRKARDTCKRGHSLDDAYIKKGGARVCRECQRMHNLAYKARK